MSQQLLTRLRHAGWFELTGPYPDRGLLHEVEWYNGLLGLGGGGAGVISAANGEGLRLAVGSGLSALFVPWSEVAVSGRRGWLGTVIELRTKAVPDRPLTLHLDDDDADAVLAPAGVTLPARRWRRGPALWLAGAVGVLAVLLIVVLALGNR